MDGKSRPQLPPPFLGEGAGMAHVFAAAIRSTGAKREAQFERLAVASDVLDAQGVILVGTSFGASVPSEQVNPSSIDAGLKGRVFVHESGADSAYFWIKDLSVRSCIRTIARWSPHSAQKWRVLACPVLYRTGAPDTIRTCDLCLRRATLYPAELRVLRGFI
jgi:hypothetical protein